MFFSSDWTNVVDRLSLLQRSRLTKGLLVKKPCVKKSLLLVAHGSRREKANNEVRDLVKKMQTMAHDFHELRSAFLELASPLIAEGLQCLIEGGATQVFVLPYFLSSGRHVTKDIHAVVEIMIIKNPAIDIKILPYFGSFSIIPRLLLLQMTDIVKGQNS